MAQTATAEQVAPPHARVEHGGYSVSSNQGDVQDLERDLGVEPPDPVTSPETRADDAGEDDSETPPKLKAGEIHKRIAKTTFEREEANRIAEAARQEANDLKAENARLKAERERPAEREEPRRTDDEQKRYESWKAGHDEADPKPQVASFDDHDAYLDARDAWNERRIDRRTERAQVERQHFERHAAIGRAADTFKTRIDTEAAKDATFGAMVQKIQIPGEGPLFEVFLDPKTPVEALVRHFDAHPDDLSNLISMRPGRQLAEVHRILGKLEARAEAAQAGSAARVKPSTTAHPPINPVAGSHVAASDEMPGDDASDDEYYAWEKRQRKAKR